MYSRFVVGKAVIPRLCISRSRRGVATPNWCANCEFTFGPLIAVMLWHCHFCVLFFIAAMALSPPMEGDVWQV